MQIHLVLGLNGEESVEELSGKIASTYPDQSMRLNNKPAWLVADDNLARIISERLGMSPGTGGIAGLVTTFTDYFGLADPEVWAWIKMMNDRPATSLLRALVERGPDGSSRILDSGNQHRVGERVGI